MMGIRTIEDLGGFLGLIAILFFLFGLPLLIVRFARNRGDYEWAAAILIFTFFGLGFFVAFFYLIGVGLDRA